MKLRLRKLLSNQRGGASIYTSMIIMVILMLASLSFATIMSRNYQRTTESQLNAQAFYAAETGIGDARSRLLQLLDSYNRGVRDILPADLTDIDDNDLNMLLNGLPTTTPPTRIGRAVAIESADQFFFSTEVAPGDVYYVEVGILLICEDNQIPARSYTTYGAPPSPIASSSDCDDAILEVKTPLARGTFQASPLICEDNQTPARSYTTHASSLITSLSECDAAISAVRTLLARSSFQAPSAGNVTSILKPTGATSDFGSVLAVRNNCLFVGDPGYNGNQGAVHTYQGPAVWTHQDTVSGGAANDRFGYSLAVASDGSKIVIGSPGHNTNAGQAHIYNNDGLCNLSFNASLMPYATTPPSYGSGSEFGSAVAFSGIDRIAVGGPGMYPDAFGNNPKGGVAVYHIALPHSPSNPGLDYLIEGSTSNAQIGESLALQNNRLVIGAPSIGKVFVHEYDSGDLVWEEKDELGSGSDEFGAALGLEGNFLAIGAPGSSKGNVYVYQYKDKTWNNEVASREGNNAGDEFGRSLSIWSRYIAVGAPGPGANKVDGFRLFRVKSLGDLTMTELSALLEQECVNKGDPNTELYNFDLLEEEDGIYYSCLSINLAPQALYYDEIEQDRSLNILLKGIDETNDPITYEDLDRLIIRWVNVEDTAGNFNTSMHYPNLEFPDYNTWNTRNYSAPVLEVQITPLNKTQGYDRRILNDLAKTVYLYPTNKSPTSTSPRHVPFSDPGQRWNQLTSGDIVEGHCGEYLDEVRASVTKNVCTVELRDLMRELPSVHYPGFHPDTSPYEVDFHLRIRSLYKPAHLEITGYSYQYSSPPLSDWQSNLAALNTRRIRFREIQAIVSATGHAGNVQVRLEERFRLQPVYDYPEHGVQSSQTVCKILVSDQDTGTDVTGGILAPSNLPTGANLNEDCAAW